MIWTLVWSQIAETLVKKVLAPPNQKTTLIDASEVSAHSLQSTFHYKRVCSFDCLVLFELLQHEVDGKTYYQFEFTAQARNYTRHALGVITVFNGIYHIHESPQWYLIFLHLYLVMTLKHTSLCCAGKFYTLTTGANERRWDKMKDRLHTVIDSFKITVWKKYQVWFGHFMFWKSLSCIFCSFFLSLFPLTLFFSIKRDSILWLLHIISHYITDRPMGMIFSLVVAPFSPPPAPSHFTNGLLL